MARQKKKVITDVSFQQAEDAFSSYNVAYAKKQVVLGKKNEEITRINNKYQNQLDGLDKEMDEAFDILQAYGEADQDNWGKKKSLDMTHGTIGFRMGQYKLVKNKKFTWDAVTELMYKHFPSLVRQKNELNPYCRLT